MFHPVFTGVQPPVNQEPVISLVTSLLKLCVSCCQVADHRRALKHFRQLLEPGEVVQVGLDTIVADADQVLHVLPPVEVKRMLPTWSSNQLLPLPNSTSLPAGAQLSDNKCLFW